VLFRSLTFEAREGIVKHSMHYKGMKNPPEHLREYALDENPPLEAQIIDLCDEIAYNNHDLDDGLESRLLDYEDLCHRVAVFRNIFEKVKSDHPSASRKLQLNETIIRLINLLVTDLIENLQMILKRDGIQTLEDIRQAPALLPCFSDSVADWNRELKSYLYTRMYNHYRVHRMKSKARRILEGLFHAYQDDEKLLPAHHQQKIKEEGKERIICDYIAGMTDRFAIDEYVKLFDPRERV